MAALRAGVPIAIGSDILASYLRGRNPREAVLLADLGMAPDVVITAATGNGPRTLGPRAPRSGLLADGYDPDVITLDGDPLDDIAVFADPDRITGVWQAGHRVPGVGSRG